MAEQPTPIIHYPENWTDLRELETAIHCHAEWFKELHRGLICGLAPKELDLLEDAHRHCRFGRWYYGEHDVALDGHQAFLSLEETHRRMHDYTREVLSQRQAGNHPDPELYDRLINQSHLFSTEMRALQFQIMGDRFDRDPLTGIPCRRSMMARLEEEASRMERHGNSSVICMLDFDRFKAINDTHGHPAGDAVLRQGVACIQEQLRPYDLMFRYGGEEFLLCFPDTRLDQAAHVAERIRLGLEERSIRLPGGKVVQVTASLGIATMRATGHLEDAIANADQALLAAKSAGRNQVMAWPEHDESASAG